jgi:hypothetical protein
MTADSSPSSQSLSGPNLGLIFVEGFRWLLLLLFALLLEKGAEGMTLRVCDEREYPLTTVFSTWEYSIGFLQFLVTVIFAARYLVCLVDPLERICNAFAQQKESLMERLHRIHAGHIILVILIAVPEIFFLFHAATSFRSFHQWLTFLLMLVVWDSIAFFFFLPSLVWVFYFLARIRPYRGKVDKLLYRPIKRARRTKTLLSIDRQAEEDESRYRDMADDLSGAIGAYIVWNILDALLLITGLLGLHLSTNANLPVSFSSVNLGTREILTLCGLAVLFPLLVSVYWHRAKTDTGRVMSVSPEPLFALLKGMFIAGSTMLIWNSLSPLSLAWGYRILICVCFGYFYLLLRSLTSLFARIDWIVIVLLLISLLTLMSQYHFENDRMPRQRIELLWAVVLLAVSAYCSCKNYLSQRYLWHGHITFLRASPA